MTVVIPVFAPPLKCSSFTLFRVGNHLINSLTTLLNIVPVKNRLKVLRAERHWTQTDPVGALKVSRQTVNAIENGKYNPSLPLAFKIARLFEKRIEEIFDDEEQLN